jgi:hypothetical protein
MKTNSTLFAKLIAATCMFLALTNVSLANEGDKPAKKNEKAATGHSFTIQLDNSANKVKTVDSAFVIFDKYDRTAAGFIQQVVYTDENSNLILENIPEGKYFVEIYTAGVHKQHFSKVITVTKSSNSKKANKLTITLDHADIYVPGAVAIPAENVKSFSYVKN